MGFRPRKFLVKPLWASLERANEWLNSPPLTAPALHGKVVLVDFWTYTCINWLRTLPYVRDRAEKYLDQGLVIGVHAPEFAKSEMIIQALLGNAGSGAIDRKPVAVDAQGIEAAADWGNLRSAENYVGYERTQNFASPGAAVMDKLHMYRLPTDCVGDDLAAA